MSVHSFLQIVTHLSHQVNRLSRRLRIGVNPPRPFSRGSVLASKTGVISLSLSRYGIFTGQGVQPSRLIGHRLMVLPACSAHRVLTRWTARSRSSARCITTDSAIPHPGEIYYWHQKPTRRQRGEGERHHARLHISAIADAGFSVIADGVSSDRGRRFK